MKAYVIKNKYGYYYSKRFFDTDYILFDAIEDAKIFVLKGGAEMIKDDAIKRHPKFICDELKVVPITICEGDLEEENRVLKKALELACEELETRDEGKTHTRLFIQKIKNNYLGDNVGYEEYFIQQAKESEKDECVDN